MELNLNTSIDYERLQHTDIKFHKGTQKKSVFHYTSIGGLEGILSSKTLRFTNIKYMNDKDEITAGLDSMVSACNGSLELKKQVEEAFLSSELQTFVCCFSLEKDSLPMWNYYTKEVNSQGYNIEFDDKKLVESILKNNPALHGCELSFGKVDYSKDNESEYSKIITTEILTSTKLAISKLGLATLQLLESKQMNGYLDALKTWEEMIAEVEMQKKSNNLPVYFYNGTSCNFEKASSGNFLHFIKRDCFRQESEFRIVISAPNHLLVTLAEKGVYKFCKSNGILVPYLELTFSPNVVKSITISPTVKSDLVELSIEEYLKYCDFPNVDYSTFIRHSGVPVRF